VTGVRVRNDGNLSSGSLAVDRIPKPVLSGGVPVSSRSVQRRVALQRGEPLPEFAGVPGFGAAVDDELKAIAAGRSPVNEFMDEINRSGKFEPGEAVFIQLCRHVQWDEGVKYYCGFPAGHRAGKHGNWQRDEEGT